jgi:dUTP pyrophosphatase
MESAYMKGYGKKFKEFKDLSEEDKKQFIKGVIEKQPITSANFYCFDITKDNKDFIDYLVTKFKATVLPTYVTFVDDNAVDFFGYIYDNFSNLQMEGAEQALANSLFQGTITFIKNDQNAVIPRKAHLSDTGFDLTIIKKVKDMGDFVEMYDTGIIVKPPEGYYCEVVGRSSISKTGYMLANNTGIIDSTYRDSIKVVLFRYDLNKPKIELPCKIAQILVKPKFNFLPIVDELPSLEETMRGEGGFGSTNQEEKK